jgi:hypothetical protein
MEIQITGTMHGRTIELDSAPGLAEGQRVEVRVVPMAIPVSRWGEGLRKSAGAMADEPEFERIMQEVQGQRKRERPGASFE